MRILGFAGLLLVAVATSAAAQSEQKPASADIPAAQRPPKGMCRIWLQGVPAAQQPAPTDCAAAVKNCPPTGRVIFGDTEESKNRPKPEPSDAADNKKSAPAKSPMIKPLVRKPPA